MSHKKHLNDKFKNELTISKSRLIFISHERVDIIAKARMFLLILLLCYIFMLYLY